MIEPRILHQTDASVLATVDALVATVATRPFTPEHVRQIDAAVRALITKRPSGVSWVHVVDTAPGESRRMPDDTRAALMDLARNAPPQARCVGIALLAEGFVAAAMRGVAAAALAAFTTPLPLRVYGSVEETCAWVEQVHRRAGSPIAPAAELARALQALREDLRARGGNARPAKGLATRSE